MNLFRDQIAAALDAIAIRSPTAYSWLGQVFEDDSHWAAVPRNGGGDLRIAQLLHSRLYADFYLPGGPAPASSRRAWRAGPARGVAVERLSAANAGRGSRQGGWAVRGRDGGSVVVERDGLALWARPEQVLNMEPRSPGDERVALVLPKERLGHSEGFFTIFGDAGGGDADAVDRFYWHLRPDGAASLIAAASEELNRERLPFRLKVVNDPTGFRRCDAGVLYTRRVDRPGIAAVLPRLRRRVAPRMRGPVPSLTLRLAEGLGFAEDPGGGESYGSHRCRLIVAGLLAAWRAGEVTTGGRLRYVGDRLRAAGIDPAHPYLGPGSPPDPVLDEAAA